MIEFPKISVIVASRNAVDTIECTLKSIKDQNYKNLELIICDGGSTDGTLDILENYRDIIDLSISEFDGGVANAQNKGRRLATGDLVTFLNADDYKEPGCFQDVAKAYREHPDMDIISTGMTIKRMDGGVYNIIFHESDLKINLKNILFKYPAFNCHFFKRDYLETTPDFKNTFPEDNKNLYSCDRHWMIKLCLDQVKNVVLPIPFHCYRSHCGSTTLSRKNLLKIRHEHLWIAAQYIDLQMSAENKALIFAFRRHNHALIILFMLYERKLTIALQTFFDCLKIYGNRWPMIMLLHVYREFRFRLRVRYLAKKKMSLFKF